MYKPKFSYSSIAGFYLSLIESASSLHFYGNWRLQIYRKLVFPRTGGPQWWWTAYWTFGDQVKTASVKTYSSGHPYLLDKTLISSYLHIYSAEPEKSGLLSPALPHKQPYIYHNILTSKCAPNILFHFMVGLSR